MRKSDVNANQKKNTQLGMPHGTAQARLRKSIMFSMMQKCGMDVCHHCGEKIIDIGKLSIEHKTPWLDSGDPVELFFDLNNITFSHMFCNTSAARRPNTKPCPSMAAYRRGCRCEECQEISKTYNKARYQLYEKK